MQNDKLRLTMIATGTVLLLATAILYGAITVFNKKISPGGLIPLAIPLILIVSMTFFILRRHRDIKEGIPFEDERSKKVLTNAAAKSFYFSLYWLLAISMFEPFFARVLFNGQKLDASQTTGGAITGMAVFFFAFWIYYDRKGKLV